MKRVHALVGTRVRRKIEYSVNADLDLVRWHALVEHDPFDAAVAEIWIGRRNEEASVNVHGELARLKRASEAMSLDRAVGGKVVRVGRMNQVSPR